MSENDLHVFLDKRRWAVRRDGHRVPLSVHDERKDAVEAARGLAAKDGGNVVVYDVGGNPLPPMAPDEMS